MPPAAKARKKSPPTAAPLEHFFHAAGLENRKLDARQTELLMQRLGQLMREMVMGLTETLHGRSEQKNVLRVAHTTIQKNNNNPLKFAAGVDEALGNLLWNTDSAYSSPAAAVRDAFNDIKIHQAALLAGMQQAFQDYLDRLDPDELERRFDNGLKRSAMLGAANKMKYWELYSDLFQVMTQHSPGRFPQLFSEELARAYEQQLEQLSREPGPATDSKVRAT
jgi:type VI secretion system FHA domain protein